ncbi:MAG: 1-deoxy-D-xylulose-5-phosphate synthase [Candidatus Aminicenantes bacterium]|nr:1-deoxy-D-xylulose-5-phosphate synthase [Candidatus Aminicenantes bacterium]
MNRILDTINGPEDLRKIPVDDLGRLATEIRAMILDVVSKNGGHLSANLGVVEITLALHRVFNTPFDKIIWDVGHQTYAHKIITGRRDRFRGLRQRGGILGFPAREESEYDAYNTGHASTALSAALGMAVARDKKAESHRIIAVVGDGSLTGGVSWEALNQIGHLRTKLIVVLNDNEMSISQSVGAISKYLGYLASGQHYLRIKDRAKTLLKSIPALGWPIIKAGRAVEELVKKVFFPGLVFEELGLRYVGPVQGHSLPSLIEVFQDARKYQDGPILIHCVTRKGRGYVPAQEDPEHFHGASPFNVQSGKAAAKTGPPSYSDVFGRTMVELGKADRRILAITAAMPEGTGLTGFAAELPGQFFDVGIAEQHAVNFAAGLAISGFKPVCAIYSTFLQRAYDQIYHDVCLQNLPVVFALDRAGVVPDDGPTHQGINDIAFLRHMPNIVLMAPRDENDLRHMLKAALGYGRPVAIRYPKAMGFGVPMDEDFKPIPLGQAEVLREGGENADLILAYGSLVHPALEAAKALEAEGLRTTVVDARFAKPLDEEIILRCAQPGRAVITVEEAVTAGGFGTAVRELLDARGRGDIRFLSVGLPIEIYPVGKTEQIKRDFRLDAPGLTEQFREFLKS